MSRKESAANFLKMIAQCDVEEAYDAYIAPDFVHHNQHFKGDRATLMAAMIEANKKMPNKTLEVKQVFEEGDFVITHSHVKQHRADIGGAVVHIFRFRGDKAVELWDLGQQIMADSPNELGPF